MPSCRRNSSDHGRPNARFCWRCDGPREVLAALAIVALVLLAVLS